MTVKEFSDEFDTRLNSYAQQQEFGEGASKLNITLDEYEKSLFLTKAQKEYVIAYYTGKNTFGYSFEEKEYVREALDALVDTYTTNSPVSADSKHLSDGKHTFTFYAIPDDLLWILYEQATFTNDTGCVCANGKVAEVIPTTHDELHRRLRNPFRGTLKTRVLRLNSTDNQVELISDYPIGSYTLRYVKEPQPIILVALTDDLSIDGETSAMTCALPEVTHTEILDRAVALAVQSKMLGASKSNG